MATQGALAQAQISLGSIETYKYLADMAPKM